MKLFLSGRIMVHKLVFFAPILETNNEVDLESLIYRFSDCLLFECSYVFSVGHYMHFDLLISFSTNEMCCSFILG